MALVFWLATLVQLLFWGLLFIRLALKRPVPAEAKALPPLSVVICARDEARRLATRLPDVLLQNYPFFEVIVVDHASADDTPAVLSGLSARFPHLRVLTCSDERPGKKVPLSMGLAAAQHPWVVLTDADCRPASPEWLRHIAGCIAPSTEIILGYGPLEKKSGFLNAFARFETAMTAIQYFSYALAGFPYMGVGRNLAYRRVALSRVSGAVHAGLVSGDDDLTVNALAHSGNTKVLLHPESFAWSAAPESWGAFARQKSRHLTTGRRYRPLHQVLLGAWALSFLGHYVLGLLAIFTGSWAIVLAGYALRQMMISIIFTGLGRKLAVQDLQWKLPLLDLSLFVYYLAFSPAVFWGSRKKWG